MAKRKSQKTEQKAAAERVAEAALRAEEARRKLDEGWRRLTKEKSEAEAALREALAEWQRLREAGPD